MCVCVGVCVRWEKSREDEGDVICEVYMCFKVYVVVVGFFSVEMVENSEEGKERIGGLCLYCVSERIVVCILEGGEDTV